MGELLEFSEEDLYTYLAKCLRIIDGDTLELDIDLGLHAHVIEKVRLADIDTPEVYGVKKDSEEYKAGKKASDRVRDLIFEDGKPGSKQLWVQTQKDAEGKYGRYVVKVFLYVDTEFVCLNDLLVKEGLAEYKEY